MVLLFIAAFMLAAAGVSMHNDFDSGFYPLLLSSLITASLGIFPMIFVDRSEDVKTKEGYAIVVGSWLLACVVGTFPYLIWGGEFSAINAWFESVSGFTTTGASILMTFALGVNYRIFEISAAILSRTPRISSRLRMLSSNGILYVRYVPKLRSMRWMGLTMYTMKK